MKIQYAEEKGIEKGKTEISKEMLKSKVPINEIMKYTKLTEEELIKLQKQL